jgi:hypothetical protein
VYCAVHSWCQEISRGVEDDKKLYMNRLLFILCSFASAHFFAQDYSFDYMVYQERQKLGNPDGEKFQGSVIYQAHKLNTAVAEKLLSSDMINASDPSVKLSIGYYDGKLMATLSDTKRELFHTFYVFPDFRNKDTGFKLQHVRSARLGSSASKYKKEIHKVRKINDEVYEILSFDGVDAKTSNLSVKVNVVESTDDITNVLDVDAPLIKSARILEALKRELDPRKNYFINEHAISNGSGFTFYSKVTEAKKINLKIDLPESPRMKRLMKVKQ